MARGPTPTTPVEAPSTAPLVLASASPRRRELLERVGVPLVVSPVTVDESVRDGERAMPYLERVVAAKLAAAQARHEGRPLLVADTSVICDGDVLGKPTDDADAVAMIRRLAGRTHQVSTRVAIAGAAAIRAFTVTTDVTFRALSREAVERYVATGEGRDKAGAYGIQGIGAALVRSVNGSYTNVVGLPLCEVLEVLEVLGLVR